MNPLQGEHLVAPLDGGTRPAPGRQTGREPCVYSVDVGSGFWQFGARGGVLPPKREEPLASHLAGGPLRAPRSLLPVPSSGTHAWQGKDGLGRPGPRSCGSSEGQLVLHKSWAPRSWGPTGKRAPLRTPAPAARWPGPAMRGPTRPPGDSAVGGGAAVLSPNLPGGRGQRVRDIHLASPPGGLAGGPHPEVVPTASSQVAADPARSRSTLRQGASSHHRPDWAHQPPNEPVRGRSPATGRLRPACHRLSSRRLRARLCRRGRAPFEGQWATRAKSARCRLGCSGLGKGP